MKYIEKVAVDYFIVRVAAKMLDNRQVEKSVK